MQRLLPLAIALSLVATGVSTAAGDQTAPPSGFWEIRAPLPIDLYGGAPASDGTYAYVAGGYTFNPGETLDTLFRFDDATNSWTSLAPMPQPAMMASAVFYPPTNKIYVFGGQHGGNGTNYAITRIYDIGSNTWSTGANMPDIRSFMASGYFPGNGKIYLVAGYRAGVITSAQSQVWEYDPVADTFDESRAPIPHALGGAASAILGGSLYVLGGRSTSQVLNENWEYRIAQNTWLLKAPLPQPTNVPGGGALGGRAYIWGGGNPFLAAPWATAQTSSYNPVLNTWTTLGNMNMARSFPESGSNWITA